MRRLTLGDDPVVVNALLDDFGRSHRVIARDLRAACLAGDAAGVRAAAHKLKSSARTVGARGLADACEALERAGIANDRAGIATLLPAFETELSLVDASLGAVSARAERLVSGT